MTDKRAEAVPCPFCGEDDFDANRLRVECLNCGATGPDSTFHASKSALDCWNTRTILSSLKGDEEMAERVVGEIERYGEGLVPELRIVCTWLANHFRTDEDARAAISVIGE